VRDALGCGVNAASTRPSAPRRSRPVREVDDYGSIVRRQDECDGILIEVNVKRDWCRAINSIEGDAFQNHVCDARLCNGNGGKPKIEDYGATGADRHILAACKTAGDVEVEGASYGVGWI